MAKKNWQAGYLVLILLLFALLAMNWTWPEEGGEESPDDLRAYLPALVGMTYHYEGMGMEFASFTRRLTFAAQGLLQLEDLSGTNLAQVVEVPLGVFYDVAVVKSRSRDGASGEVYEYYAKNVGLIKREFILESEGETFTVTSSLKALSFPPAM